MNFFDHKFLIEHIESIMNFYDAIVVDVSGGYFQNYMDDGSLFDPAFRQLVSSSRIVVNYALASKILKKAEYLAIAQHGLNYVEQVHWQNDKQCYAWTLRNHQPEDMTQQAYGYAFVLLAYAAARKAGIIESDDKLVGIYYLLEERFWLEEHGLYADEISADGLLSDYRGQNANMHLCEAMLSAYEASQQPLFLQRAKTIAYNIAIRQADKTDGLVWEHYTTGFVPDWSYNKNDPKNLYRPWGFQSGHQTEWSKLLLTLNKYSPDQILVDRAKLLFDRAYNKAWDNQYGGLIYGFSPEGEWCDDDKYFWVQAESFAAAAMLYQVTGESRYLDHYQSLWQYSWQHLVDHKYGAWYRVLHRNNKKYSSEKSAAGAKCDYHTLGACFEVIDVLENHFL